MSRSPTGAPRSTSTFAALRHREFRLMWIGLVTTGTGSWMQQLGLGWLVVLIAIQDGVPNLAPFYIGLVGLSRAVPALVSGLFSGAVADRFDRRRLLLITQSAGSVLAGVMAVLVIGDRVGIVTMLVFSACFSVANAFDVPTRQAMLTRLVPAEDLMSGVGLFSAAVQGATLAGPLLGGLLIVPVGVGGLFVANALSRLVTVGTLLAMRPQPTPAAAVRKRGSLLAALRDGVDYVGRNSVLRSVILMNMVISLGGRGYNQLMPAVAHDALHVGAIELSWLLAGSGIGTLAGSFVTATLGGVRRRGLFFCGSVVAGGLLLVLFSLQGSLAAAIAVLSLAAFAISVSYGLSVGTLQSRTPNELRGRVMSFHVTTFQGFSPLGVLMLGSLGSLVGIEWAIGLGGLAIAVAAAIAFFGVSALRELTAADEAGDGDARGAASR